MNAKFMKLYTSTALFFFLIIVAFSTVDAAWKQNRNMPSDYINRTYLDVYSYLQTHSTAGFAVSKDAFCELQTADNHGKDSELSRKAEIISN